MKAEMIMKNIGDTKEKILQISLHLFAQRGYQAVSVNDIAQQLGITKGALYRHYQNKQDIFQSICRRMEQQDTEKAQEHDLPEDTLEQMPEKYAASSFRKTVEFSKAMFHYWTEDPFASDFRKMLTLEQFSSSEMNQLYHQYLGAGPIGYLADLFAKMGFSESRQKAMAFYAPIYLLYGIYDWAEDKKQIILQAEQSLEQHYEAWKNEIKGEISK